MAFRDDLAALESDLALAQVPVSDVLAAAGVHRITYWRWQQDRFLPRLQTWESLRRIADQMIAEKVAA